MRKRSKGSAAQKTRRHPSTNPYHNKTVELVDEANRLIGKCGFLVHRSEFLYQQGLMFNVQAQELIADCRVSGTEISAMTAKLDKLTKLLVDALVPKRRK